MTRTLAYQWLVKQRLGVTVEFVESPDLIHVPPELLIERIDERTALVATSRVFYTSGYVQNVAAVVEAAHARGAYVLIDDYQGTGQIPIDVHALNIDFLVTGTLKWLMGGPGLGLVYVREGLIGDLQPTMTGRFANRDQFQQGRARSPRLICLGRKRLHVCSNIYSSYGRIEEMNTTLTAKLKLLTTPDQFRAARRHPGSRTAML